MGLDREKLTALITERGTTPRAVSRAIGDNPYIVRDIMSGKSKNPRSDTLSKIADHLGVALPDIMTGEPGSGVGENGARFVQIVPRYLPVRYRVQAGHWIEVDAFAQEFPSPPNPIAPDPRYADWPQWLEEVVGDSIDLKIQPGGFAHVVDAIEMGYAPRTGHWVVVERRRAGGSLRERTIKQLEVTDDGDVKLWPRSTNPKWSEPISLTAGAEDGDVEVEIVGLVIGAYSSFV